MNSLFHASTPTAFHTHLSPTHSSQPCPPSSFQATPANHLTGHCSPRSPHAGVLLLLLLLLPHSLFITQPFSLFRYSCSRCILFNSLFSHFRCSCTFRLSCHFRCSGNLALASSCCHFRCSGITLPHSQFIIFLLPVSASSLFSLHLRCPLHLSVRY